MKILVIEDEIMMLKALEFRLKKDGHETVTAEDGKAALAKINTEDFDMIITDIMLPFATGLEIVNHVRGVLNKNIPIIVLSAVGLEKTVLEAFDLGADDFITKPFSPNELSMRVKRLASRR